MAVITPNTDLYLLKVPLEIDSVNQLTFSNATAQFNYFNSLPKLAVDDFTYQRKDGTIRFSANFDEIVTYNYVMYRNTEYSNKWFYAYITDIEYLNDSVSAVAIKTDVWQTWQFDLNYKRTFVEREHVNDDTIGLHTVPENLDLGEYQINATQHFSLNGDYEAVLPSDEKWWVCFVVTQPPEPNNPVPIVPNTGADMGNAFSALTYFAVSSANGYADAKAVLDWYKKSPSTLTDTIINMYMIPYSCVDASTYQSWTRTDVSPQVTFRVYAVRPTIRLQHNSQPVTENTVMSGSYTPRNKKLYTYPYSYLYMSNKNGTDIVYHWEDGGRDSDNMPTFSFYTAIVPSASLSAKLYPQQYKGKSESSSYYGLWNYGISYGKIPLCAWMSDYYTNWLTQNGVNIATNIATSAIGAGIGLVTGVGAIAGVAGLGSTIANTMAEIHKASVTPDQAQGDVNVGDSTFAYTRNNITAYHMSIRSEYSRMIDSYFDMFGYKINRVKLPNITGRRNWNYVKTIGCYIDADIPQGDLQEIKDMFDKGVTFWHNPATFADYSQNNDII